MAELTRKGNCFAFMSVQADEGFAAGWTSLACLIFCCCNDRLGSLELIPLVGCIELCFQCESGVCLYRDW